MASTRIKASTSKLKSAMKKVIDRVTHEIPTGPHTDVRRRKINPSFRNPNVESGALKEFKRKKKIMGMGLKNVVKRMVGQKEGGRIGKQHGGRTNLLEELGRVEGEHSNRNRRAEVSRIHGELNKGYKSGNLVEAAKKGVSKWKEKQKAAQGITKKAADALQKHIQTKNVKRLTTTGGAYKKRAPIKVVDKKTSAHPGGGYHGYKMYKSGGVVLKGKKVGIQIK